ncbi:MAG: type IV pilus assembly protein PilQ [Pseudoalteromonas tetraodonis]|jgi:type IV pilus assembly protein PilQ
MMKIVDACINFNNNALSKVARAAALLALLSIGQTALAVDLAAIKYLPSGSDQGRLLLTFTGDAPAAKTFGTDSPARIALDYKGVGSVMSDRKQQFGSGPVNSVMGAASGNRLRVVVSLHDLVPFEITTNQNTATVWLNTKPTLVSSGAPASLAVEPYVEEAAAPVSQPEVVSAPNTQAVRVPAPAAPQPAPEPIKRTIGKTLTGIDFRRGVNGEGRVVLDLSDRNIVPNIRTIGTTTVVELEGVQLAGGVAKNYDVLDFGTPVTGFMVEARKRQAEVSIATSGDFEQTAFRSGSKYVVEFHPLTPEEVEAKFPFSGERININFQSIEVRALLEIIADVASINIVVSDTVKGSVTLRLNDVPWDQALELVLTTKGLDKRESGNVIYVAPMDEIAKREQDELLNAQKNETLSLLTSQLIPLNYAKAADIEKILKTKSGGGNNTQQDSATLLSERGSVSFDERTNTLLIYQTKEKLAEIYALVKKLDVPVRQVLIESRIVIASKSFSNEIGVRFGATTAQPFGNGAIGITGSGSGAAGLVEGFRTGGFPVTPPAYSDRLATNLPSGAAGSLGLAILSSDYLLDLELSALQAEGKGEIVSNPRVITANQQKASIQQGVEVPFQTVSQEGASVQFKQATLALEVTPLITPDGRVLMDLAVSKDSIGQLVSNGSGGFIPSIDTRSVETQVLVEDGETVVLGGIYEVSRANAESKVPVLGDLPILGNLFRTKKVTDEKSELLIFVTPRVLRDGLKAEY